MEGARRILFVTTARSASNLFVRVLLSEQPDVVHGEYNFHLAATEIRGQFARLDPLDDVVLRDANAQIDGMRHKVETHFDDIVAQGKIATCKEHAFFMLHPQSHQADFLYLQALYAGDPAASELRKLPPEPVNPTALSDDFLRSVTPVFLIRHPALMIPSYFRIMGDIQMAGDATLWWSRLLYDWYSHQPGSAKSSVAQPLVIDASDFIARPDLLRKLAIQLKLDPMAVVTQWQAASEQEKADWQPIKVKMTKTLASSSGVLVDTARIVLDIDAEADEWKGEFGEDAASKIKALVNGEMQNYDYLWSRRLRFEYMEDS